MVLSHVMQERPGCLLQSARGEANRILLASALSSIHALCPNRVRQHDWIILAMRLASFIRKGTGEGSGDTLCHDIFTLLGL